MTTGSSGNEWGKQGVPKYGDNIYDPDYTPDAAPTVNFAAPQESAPEEPKDWYAPPGYGDQVPTTSYRVHTEEGGNGREAATDTSWMTFGKPKKERDPRVDKGVTDLKLMGIRLLKMIGYMVFVFTAFCFLALVAGMISAVL